MAVAAAAAAGGGPAAVRSSKGLRRRRSPVEARDEITRAALDLLTEGTASAVSIAAIMERTSLSRKSFYVHFRDRTDLLEALVRPLRADADAALARWRQAEDPVVAGTAALRAAAATYREHGAVLRAVFWSATDPETFAVRAALTDPVIEVAQEILARVTPDLPRPRETARALVTMNVHRLLALPPDATDAELDDVVDTLATIWERTMRGGHPLGPPV